MEQDTGVPSRPGETDLRLAELFAERMRQTLGSRVSEIRLFGSRARGDADEESDYDFFVALQDDDPRRDVRKVAARLANQFSLDHGIVVSVLVGDRAFLDAHQGYSLLETIRTEGVAL